MTWMKRTALAFAAGAALLMYALVPGSASPAGQAAATGAAALQSGSDVIEVRHGGGGRWHGHGGWGRHGHGGWGRHGHWGHGRWRHHGGWWWGAPFIAAPFLYDGYYGGYGYGNGYGRSCYQLCRRYHGPNYCRWHSRRYC